MKKPVLRIFPFPFFVLSVVFLILAFLPSYVPFEEALAAISPTPTSDQAVGGDERWFIDGTYYLVTKAEIVGESIDGVADLVIIHLSRYASDDGGLEYSWIYVYDCEAGTFVKYTPSTDGYAQYSDSFSAISRTVPNWKIYGWANPSWYFFIGLFLLGLAGLFIQGFQRRKSDEIVHITTSVKPNQNSKKK